MDLQPPRQPPTQRNLQKQSLLQIFTTNKWSFVVAFLFLLLASIIFYMSPLQSQYLLHNSLLSQVLPFTAAATKNSGCEYSYGKWVRDYSQEFVWYNEECPFLDPGFRCHRCGRQDLDYLKWKWQPGGCDLPRFNSTDFLEKSRNRRIVFAGDSISRNQWESLLCMLTAGVSNLSTIYEVNGSPISKHKGYLSMCFSQYNLTVEYYRAPFLVENGHPPPNAPKEVVGVINVDKLHQYSVKWVGADVVVFNAGHWWNQEKTVKMHWFFQEGGAINMTMDCLKAFQKSLYTWKSWVLQNFDPERSHIFYRSYSPVHYRGGTWNEGGQCDTNTAPETNQTKLEAEPLNNLFISNVIKQIETTHAKVHFLNITQLAEFRSDGHPSRHREPGTIDPSIQDCSHWCLPGVPDTWNEILYANLLSKGYGARPK